MIKLVPDAIIPAHRPTKANHLSEIQNTTVKAIKSLLVSVDVPTDAYGTGQRLLSLRQALERLGECRFLWLAPHAHENPSATVDYLAPSGLPRQPSRSFWIRRMLTFGEFRQNAPALARMDEIWNDYHYDIVICSFFRAAGAAPFHRAPCILDVDCLPQPAGRLSTALWPVTRWMMNRCAAKFRKVFVISARDSGILDGVDTTLLPCISATAGPPVEVDPQALNVLFIGGTKWAPNRESIEYLIQHVQPRLPPRFKLRLVGSGTEAYTNIPNISAAGFVADTRSEYRQAALVVCPVWSGGGANVKLAEALQNGSAVVASAHAAARFEGVLVPGEHAMVAPDRQAFPDVVARLLQDDLQLARLRQNARLLGRTTLSQDHIDQLIARAVEESIEAPSTIGVGVSR